MERFRLITDNEYTKLTERATAAAATAPSIIKPITSTIQPLPSLESVRPASPPPPLPTKEITPQLETLVARLPEGRRQQLAKPLLTQLLTNRAFSVSDTTLEILLDNVLIPNSNIVELIYWLTSPFPITKFKPIGLNVLSRFIIDQNIPRFLIKNPNFSQSTLAKGKKNKGDTPNKPPKKTNKKKNIWQPYPHHGPTRR